jgi:probable rRNA maturation factor
MEKQKSKHKIYTRHCGSLKPEIACKRLVKKAVLATLWSESVDTLCVISVLLTDDKGIRKYNREYRGIDKATDVLSFPMQEFRQAGWGGCEAPELDEDTGDLPLGDIVLSMESAIKQAQRNKFTPERETALLIIHSTLHLLGYVHDDKAGEKEMQSRERSILKEMGFKSDDK